MLFCKLSADSFLNTQHFMLSNDFSPDFSVFLFVCFFVCLQPSWTAQTTVCLSL